MNLVLEQASTRVLTPSSKSVLLMIANNANDEGRALSLKVSRIHDQTNLDERTIQKSFRVLQEEGFISIEEKRGRVSIYTVHIDRLLQATPGVRPGVVDSGSRGTSGDAKSTGEEGARRVADRSPVADDHVKAGGRDSSSPGSRSPSTPGVRPGVASCASTIHTPGVDSPAPGVRPGVPPASGHPPPALVHPSSSLLQELNISSPGEPDRFKNGCPEPEVGPDERKRRALADIDRALQGRSAAGAASP